MRRLRRSSGLATKTRRPRRRSASEGPAPACPRCLRGINRPRVCAPALSCGTQLAGCGSRSAPPPSLHSLNKPLSAPPTPSRLNELEMEGVELCLLANLAPENAEEAYALIPSLKVGGARACLLRLVCWYARARACGVGRPERAGAPSHPPPPLPPPALPPLALTHQQKHARMIVVSHIPTVPLSARRG